MESISSCVGIRSRGRESDLDRMLTQFERMEPHLNCPEIRLEGSESNSNHRLIRMEGWESNPDHTMSRLPPSLPRDSAILTSGDTRPHPSIRPPAYSGCYVGDLTNEPITAKSKISPKCLH